MTAVVPEVSAAGDPAATAAGAAVWPRVALALFGGFLVALSMPPWGFWPLAFVGVATFDVSLGTFPGRRVRGWCGFAFGFGWLAMAMGWMWHLTPPGYIVAAALYAGYHAVAALAAPIGPWRVIGRPAAHSLAEALRFVFPFGGVPVASIGIAQAGGPLLGVARVGGVILISWVVFQTAIAIVALVRVLRAGRSDADPVDGVTSRRITSRAATSTERSLALAGLGAVALTVAVASVAPTGRDTDDAPLTVAAVQGGGEQGTSALDVPSSLVTARLLEATRTIDPDPDLDLVVWPENGIDVDDEPFPGSEAERLVAAEAARLGVPFSVGVTLDSEYSQHPVGGSFVNAQAVVTPDGEVTSAYEKVRIVPFGEYVPLRGLLETFGAPLDQIPSDATAGRGPALIELPDGTRLGVMISWEVFFGRRGRAADDGAILLNPTNGASYTGTILQTQQIASSRLRATETGRWVVQVSPTGFTAFVSPDGEVLQRTAVSEQAVIRMDVPRRTGTTWYSALGDWPWSIALAATLALSRVAARRAPGGRDRAEQRSTAPAPA